VYNDRDYVDNHILMLEIFSDKTHAVKAITVAFFTSSAYNLGTHSNASFHKKNCVRQFRLLYYRYGDQEMKKQDVSL